MNQLPSNEPVKDLHDASMMSTYSAFTVSFNSFTLSFRWLATKREMHPCVSRALYFLSLFFFFDASGTAGEHSLSRLSVRQLSTTKIKTKSQTNTKSYQDVEPEVTYSPLSFSHLVSHFFSLHNTIRLHRFLSLFVSPIAAQPALSALHVGLLPYFAPRRDLA